jgi:sulfur carrier protein|tara:strand:- start:864 stop:1085 length:222 start_codon:yes stop_codon:yes gene_type:complete
MFKAGNVMQVQVNGDAMELPEEVTVAVLIERMALVGKRFAVEVNEDIVPRSQHATFSLNDGDRVEVVHAIGGG